MRKALIVSVLIASSCLGQNSPVWFQQLFNNVTANTTSALVQNTGQPFHLVYTWISDVPGHTCVLPPSGAETLPITFIEVSMDGVVFQQVNNSLRVIQSNSQGPTNRYRYLVSVSGNWEWLKVFVSNPDSTNCQFSAWYAGGVVALDITKTLTIQGQSTTSGDNAQNIPIDITTATTTSVIPANPNTPIQYAIYGLFLYNSTASQTIKIGAGGGNCGSFSQSFSGVALTLDTVAANQVVFNQFGTSPFMLVPPSCALEIQTSGTGPLSGFVLERVE